MSKSPKLYKCKAKGCDSLYEKRRPLQNFCSPTCGYAIALERLSKIEKKKEKARKASTRLKREEIKTKPELTKEAQREFNRYIVQRDWLLPCICCGKFTSKSPLRGGIWNAGHYLSVGAHPEKRFNEDNVHKQLAYCNKYLQGDAGDYRVNLIEKIGLARVEAVEASSDPLNLTHDELREIRDHYRKEAVKLKKKNLHG